MTLARVAHRSPHRRWSRPAFPGAKAVRDIVRDVWRIRRYPQPFSQAARILHVIETGGPGGAERMLVDLAGRLRPEYHATIGLLKPGWLESQAVAAGIPVKLLRAGDELGVVVGLLDIVRSGPIDVIHAHEFYMSGVGAIVSWLTGIPLVITVHGKNYYPERRRRRLIYRLVGAQAVSVVAVSQDLRQFFCRTTGVPADRVHVVYNGIDIGRPWDTQRDPGLLKASGIPPWARIVGAVGNLYAVKGHIHLIRALPTILQTHPTTHLVILGRGDLRDTLGAQARALGLEDRVHLLGYCDDVTRWLGAMDVFASSSLSEGLPLSLLEAMAAGKPAVVTDVGGVSEVVRDGETGFLVPAADPDALASKIALVLDDAALAKDMGAAGQAHVRELFSLDGMADQYRAVYQTALGCPGGRGVRPTRDGEIVRREW